MMRSATRRWIPTMLAIWTLGAGFLSSAPAFAAGSNSDAASFISGLATKVLHTVNDSRLSPTEQEQRIYDLANQGFDIPAIARFTLGGYWRLASPNERKEFTQVFEQYMVQFYTTRFREYKNVTFRITGVTPQGDDTTLVHSAILQGGDAPPATVDWRIIEQNGEDKIVDVSIEGVSELLTYRDEFGALLGRNGGDVSALIAQLRNKVQGQS